MSSRLLIAVLLSLVFVAKGSVLAGHMDCQAAAGMADVSHVCDMGESSHDQLQCDPGVCMAWMACGSMSMPPMLFSDNVFVPGGTLQRPHSPPSLIYHPPRRFAA